MIDLRRILTGALGRGIALGWTFQLPIRRRPRPEPIEPPPPPEEEKP